MKHRDVVLMLGGLILAAALAILLLSGTPGEVAAGGHAVAAEAVPAPDRRSDQGTPADEPMHPSEVQAVAAAVADDRHDDTVAMTSGIIRGDIQLTTSILDQIQSIQVIVEELRNPVAKDGTVTRPFRQVVPVKRGTGTPTFEVSGVPFSSYGYAVSAYSPGLNGGRRTVSITSAHPVEDGVLLAIGPGVPFSVLLRDQDMLPLAQVDVSMLPVGEPPGRGVFSGKTDNFGSLAFDKVLAGDYRVFVGPVGQPLMDPVEVTVQTAGVVYHNGKAQSQGATIYVQRGSSVSILVVDDGNFGLADVTVEFTATDRVHFTPLKLTTDAGGHANVPHLQNGVWQIDVSKENYGRRSRQITVKEGEPVPEVTFQMLRLR